MKQIEKLYKQFNILNSFFFETDCEFSLINVIFLIFSNAQHALCTWHVDKNVVKNCKSSFDDEESWKIFYKHWHDVMYAEIETIYKEIWKSLQNKYEKNYWSAVNYLRDELLTR